MLKHNFIKHSMHNTCFYCGREANDYEYHFEPASPAQISDEPNKNLDLCDCGHRREKHYRGLGLCEATAVNGHICVCSRFKYPKFDIKVEDAKLVVTARSRLEPVEAVSTTPKDFCDKCDREIVLVVGRTDLWRHVWGEMENKDFAKLERLGCFNNAKPKVSTLLPQQDGIDDCPASGESHRYGENGPNGEIQCGYCGGKPIAPPPQQEEPAEQAWNRAFQYVNRHGWTSELDGIPHYTAPKEFRNSPIAPLLEQEEAKLLELNVTEQDAINVGVAYVKAKFKSWSSALIMETVLGHISNNTELWRDWQATASLNKRESQLLEALTSLAAATEEVKEWKNNHAYLSKAFEFENKCVDAKVKALKEIQEATGMETSIGCPTTKVCVQVLKRRAELAESKLSEAQQTIEELRGGK